MALEQGADGVLLARVRGLCRTSRPGTAHRAATSKPDIPANHPRDREHLAHPVTERYLAHFSTGRSFCCIGAAHPSQDAARHCGRREARFRGDGSTFEIMTLDEHEARLALLRRRTREGLRLLVESIQSRQAEGDCEVSVVLALNGVAVQVQRTDPITGQQQAWQEIREDSYPVGM